MISQFMNEIFRHPVDGKFERRNQSKNVTSRIMSSPVSSSQQVHRRIISAVSGTSLSLRGGRFFMCSHISLNRLYSTSRCTRFARGSSSSSSLSLFFARSSIFTFICINSAAITKNSPRLPGQCCRNAYNPVNSSWCSQWECHRYPAHPSWWKKEKIERTFKRWVLSYTLSSQMPVTSASYQYPETFFLLYSLLIMYFFSHLPQVHRSWTSFIVCFGNHFCTLFTSARIFFTSSICAS